MPADPYITVEEAEELALCVADTAAWQAAAETDGLQEAALAQASDEIDTLQFDGVPYEAGQARQFPRFVEGLESATAVYRGRGCYGVVWDLVDGEAAVPDAVKLAVFLQAISILRDAHRRQRLQDRHDGVVAQSAGGVSEQYSQARPNLVCVEAHAQIRRYLRMSGSIVG